MFLGWGALILFLYFRHHKFEIPLMYVAYLVREFLIDFSPSMYLLDALRSSALIFVFSVSLLIWGQACVHRAGREFPGLLSAGLGLAFGLGVTSTVVALLTFLHALYPAVAWAVYVLSILAAGACLKSGHLRPALDSVSKLSFASKAVLAGLAAVVWIGSLIPEITYDPLVYHLAYPSLYKLHHGFVPMTFSFYASFPQTVEMLYLFGLLIGDEITSKAFQFIMTLALMLILLGAAERRFNDPRIGVWGLLVFCSQPMFFFNIWNCMIDIGTTLFSFAALVLVAEALDADGTTDTPGRRRTLLGLAGLFCGWAMGTKYTAFPLIVTLPLVAAVAGRHLLRRDPAVVRHLLTFTAAALLIVSPWVIRNIVVHHNPVYPFFGTKWGTPPVEEFHLNKLMADASGHSVKDWISNPRSFIHTVLAPFHWLQYGRTTAIGSDTGPLLLFCVGCLLLSFFLNEGRAPPDLLTSCCAWFALIGWLQWLLTGGLPRFVMPYLVPLFWVWSRWAASELFAPAPAGGRPWIVTGLRLMVLMMLAISYINGLADFTVLKSRHVLRGVVDKETFLTLRHSLYPSPPYAAYQFINQSSPPDAGVLVIGDARAYYLDRPFIIGTAQDLSPIIVLARQSEGGEDLHRRLVEKNIRHIVINAAEALRTKTYKYLQWDERSFLAFKEFWSVHAKLSFQYVDESEGAALFVYDVVDRSDEPADIPSVIIQSWIDQAPAP